MLPEPTSSDPASLDPDLRHHYEWNLQVGDADAARFQFVIQADRDKRRASGIHGLFRPPTDDAQSVYVQAQPPGFLYRQVDDQAVVEAKTASAVDAEPAAEPAKKAPTKRAPRKQAE